MLSVTGQIGHTVYTRQYDATPHTLRHTGASLATSAGATTADVMARLGHSTPAMAMHYQHSLDGADERVARKLSQMAEAASER